ncbi:hypothetical protein Klosneuvirus_3_189 [Klosneuvirus KNV1]|uniref:Uncharacterized protein n=1 Tax=Klosneuvirus KNV1 TaxID=1977640 RepID=A0A1V0SKA7_9VIRU|nr:hypothetical protein Klosneuvirus_3_189 [Klosneuvirus KNV1]
MDKQSVLDKYKVHLDELAKIKKDVGLLTDDDVETLKYKLGKIKKILDDSYAVIQENQLKQELHKSFTNIIEEKYKDSISKKILVEAVKQCIKTFKVNKRVETREEFLDYKYTIFGDVTIDMKYSNSNRDSFTLFRCNYREFGSKNEQEIKTNIENYMTKYFSNKKTSMKSIYEQNKNTVVNNIYDLVKDMQKCIMELEYKNFFDDLVS